MMMMVVVVNTPKRLMFLLWWIVFKEASSRRGDTHHRGGLCFFFSALSGKLRTANTDIFSAASVQGFEQESQFDEALRNQGGCRKVSADKNKDARQAARRWSDSKASGKSNGMFTHCLPASPPLHWLLIHIFWFIEARASHFNQGSFLSHGPLIPSISLPASPFFPPQCTLKEGRERKKT